MNGLIALAVVPALAAPEDLAGVFLAQAISLEHGEGVAQDYPQAGKLYCHAAKLGNAQAQFNLGWMYANGRGVARDDGLAAYFFNLAAQQGHVQAKNVLRLVGSGESNSVTPPECMKDIPPPPPVSAPEEEFEAPGKARILALINKLAPEYAIDPKLAVAVVTVESNFQETARSPKNAQGLMQLIPETAARFQVRDSFDPRENLKGGLAYLRWLLAYFQGDVALAAAGYNAGEGAVNKYKGIPPYEETRAYVHRILKLFPQRKHPFDPQVTLPSPLLPIIRNKVIQG